MGWNIFECHINFSLVRYIVRCKLLPKFPVTFQKDMENLSKEDTKELTKEQRLFVALLKENGFKYHKLPGGE